MIRAIYTEAHTQTWLDIALRLRAKQGVEPCYWVGKQHFEPTVRKHFPDAVFHSRTDAIRGMPAPGMAAVRQRPLDADVLRRFSGVLLAAGKMMDRLDVDDGFRMEERVRLFHVQLRYWRGVLDALRPDLVIFPVQPHTVYDYVLYELCQDYGITTSMFQWTLFHDWIYPLDHIEHGYTQIRERYAALLKSADDVQLNQAAEDYLVKVNGDYRKAIPDYLVNQMPPALHTALFAGSGSGDFGLLAQQIVSSPVTSGRRAFPPIDLLLRNRRAARKYLVEYLKDQFHSRRRGLKQSRKSARRATKMLRHGVARNLSVRSIQRTIRRVSRLPRRAGMSIKRFYRRYLKIAVRAVMLGDMNRPLKEPGKRTEESYRGRWGGARLQYLRLLGGAKKRALLRDYHDRCATPDFSAPYVFLALHYQPEQTTSPTGGVFVDQQIAVDMLARLVPPGWRVYVKEHPFQFFPTSIGERSRPAEFYEDLLAHPNVMLVPWSVSPFDLIDGARAVATVTGTTGIEAVMRGKPVLVFGHAWYAGCEGVFYTPDSTTCREVLTRVADGYTVDRRKVRVFLKAVQDSCFRADMDFGVIVDPPIPHEQNVARLAGGIQRILQRQHAQAATMESFPA